MSQDVPIVHPIIRYIEDYFKENTHSQDVVEEHRKDYIGNRKIQFDDVVGLVISTFIQLNNLS